MLAQTTAIGGRRMKELLRNVLTLILIALLVILGIRMLFVITGIVIKLIGLILLIGVIVFLVAYVKGINAKH